MWYAVFNIHEKKTSYYGDDLNKAVESLGGGGSTLFCSSCEGNLRARLKESEVEIATSTEDLVIRLKQEVLDSFGITEEDLVKWRNSMRGEDLSAAAKDACDHGLNTVAKALHKIADYMQKTS